MSTLDRFLSLRFADPGTGLGLDLSTMGIERAGLEHAEADWEPALAAMAALERGAIANPSEDRRVGHYWLRAPELAPEPAMTAAIRTARASVEDFAARVRDGALAPPEGGRFERLLLCGIGGSALGPQLLAEALPRGSGGLVASFCDNTDPEGIADRLAALGPALARTLVLVVSKSGGTKETRNAMLEVRAALEAAGHAWPARAVAVTGEGSALDRQAAAEGWLARFPMWDWVGGRTSLASAVGLLPSALQGHDVAALLDGMAAMDAATRRGPLTANLAALMAEAWRHASGGVGSRDLVVIPYRDRLALLGRYLQQLVMESLGKEKDLTGRVVHQGLTVYGNKGSTDQHAYVQQLRDGVANFFVGFVRVLEDGAASGVEVEPEVGSADYLQGFWLGTRRALAERGRPSLTLTLPRLDAAAVGALVALFERAVGLYAARVGVNAYDQPGVEAGKRAAGRALTLRQALLAALGPQALGLDALLARVPDADPETALLLLEHLAANSARTGVQADARGYRRVKPS